ncbi:GTP-binding protein ERG [Aristolochia californica]|uniref:GTP-binding protein ERG n=1 Tax=Aristolochia californica TaxID=171875 RepID=UPI0035DA5FC6
MQSWRSFRTLTSLSRTTQIAHSSSFNILRLFASQPQPQNPIGTIEDSDDSVFDSSDFRLPTASDSAPKPTWNKSYREKADRAIFGIEQEKRDEEEEKKRRANMLAKALLEASLGKADDEEDAEMLVKEEDQQSLSVGIIGVPNAGKSALTNYMVGTKVAAVSRKTNTTTHEVLGVLTKGNTQICFFDTPGLMLRHKGYLHKDVRCRVQSAWSSIDLYDLLIVIFDVHRHLTKPDSRVTRLVRYLGAQQNPKQKRVLCMNKVDLVEVKKDLLKVAQEFGDLPGYEKYFMISGLKGSGVKDLVQFLMEQALKRPWDEEPTTLTEEVMKNIALEVVREKMLDHIHQEIPYAIEQRLMSWKELRDGSIRVEQQLITHKQSQRKIIIGKNGCKIGRIGMEANEELRSIFKRDVHLVLQVKVA